MYAKSILCLVALLCAASVIADSECGYGYNQIWDVKRVTGTCQTVGGICTVFDFQTPFLDPYDNGVKVNAGPGQYYQFFYSGEAANPIGLKLYNSDGTPSKVVATAGRFTAIGDKGILYVGKEGACGGVPVGCGTGYFISRNGGLTPTSSTQFSFTIIAIDPTLDDVLYKYQYDFCVDEPKYLTTSSTTTTTPAPNMDSCKRAFPDYFKTTAKNAIKDPFGSAIQGAIDATSLKMAGLSNVQQMIAGKQPNLKGAIQGAIPFAIPTLPPFPFKP